ncbi:Ribosomal L1 domain-containing protein [Pseudolycoriella hygida]|uniref:Ribosomal L1 domain-containing protein n=1 Tax=Pseudolycoriella hygida TaxID=35572 RepID=A0A9Q0N4Q9_9DIPT|nr:Ribosomal L1 domain-containing protein [Pseudolycoriella hygida]
MAVDPKTLFTRKWMLANHKSPSPFHQAKFDTVFSNKSILKHIEDLKSAIDIEMYVSSRLLPEDFYIDLEIYSHKHPHIPINLSRVIIPHACHNDDTSVLVFVKDSRIGGRKLAKPEQTIKQYETLFRNKNIDQKMVTFMPLSQFLNDYAGYEERRKLSFMYEQFIADKDISVKVNSFLGSKLINEGRAAFPLDFSDQEQLADIFDETLRMVYYMYTPPIDEHESKSVIHVGRHSMSNEDIVENIIDVLHQLQDLHPGGCNNVSKMVVRANTQIDKVYQIYIDNSAPVYPEATPDDATENANKPDPDEHLLQKVYVHVSIIPCDSVVMDKEEEMLAENRRDFNPSSGPPQNKPQNPSNANLEQQVVNALKQFVNKAKVNANAAPPGSVTENRVIRRRRVQVGGRTGRMF